MQHTVHLPFTLGLDWELKVQTLQRHSNFVYCTAINRFLEINQPVACYSDLEGGTAINTGFIRTLVDQRTCN